MSENFPYFMYVLAAVASGLYVSAEQYGFAVVWGFFALFWLLATMKD